MQIIIFGKQSFVSKSGKPCNIIHYGFKSESVEGLSVDHKFVDSAVYNKAVLNKNYSVVYGELFGKAIIADIVEVS